MRALDGDLDHHGHRRRRALRAMTTAVGRVRSKAAVVASATLVCIGVTLQTDAGAAPASSGTVADTAAELAACVRELRAETPALGYQAGVVRCLRPTRVETRSDVRWSTCKDGGAPAPGERCETGSARVELRATDVDWEFRRGENGYPRQAERWHLFGRGTARCTRAIHGLPRGDPRARRTAAGRIEHADWLMLWPTGERGRAIAVGVHPGWSNWLRTAPPPDAIEIVTPACRPLAAVLFSSPRVLPPFARIATSSLLDPEGVRTTTRARYVRRDVGRIEAPIRPVGAQLVAQVRSRTTTVLEVDSTRTIE